MTITFVTTGTVAVENDSKLVTGTGTLWLATSVKQGDTLLVQGVQNWVDSLDVTTQVITLAVVHTGATASGLAYAISPTSPEWVRNMTVSQHLAQQILAQQAIGAGLSVAVSDELYAFSSGPAALTFRAPQAMQLSDLLASVKTASTAGPITIDVNVNGASILSTKLTIDQGEKTSASAAVPCVISSARIEQDDEITIDIDGAGANAVGLKLNFIAAQP